MWIGAREERVPLHAMDTDVFGINFWVEQRSVVVRARERLQEVETQLEQFLRDRARR